MKKIIYNIFIAIFILFPCTVFAAGYISVSPTSLTIEEGSSKTFTITAYNTIGDVKISSSNTSVASVSASEWETGMVGSGETKKGTITVKGLTAGTTTVSVVIRDAATFDEEVLTGTKTITITVKAKETTNNNNSNNNKNNSNSNNNSNKNSNSTKNNNSSTKTTKSTDNSLKSISIDGYDLVKVDKNNYTLTVSNNVTTVNVKATPNDSKATITGTGSHDLNVGTNTITLTVTSESGAKNKINIKVTRKDGYYLEDLDDLLNNSDTTDININIDSDTIISKDTLNKIKTSKKTVNFNYYNSDKELLYSWIVNGSELDNINDLNTKISFDSDKKNIIYELSNYADNLYISLSNKEDLPTGTKLKLYIGDKFGEYEKINIYYYNEADNKLEEISKSLNIDSGYILLDIDKCSEYIATLSNIVLSADKEQSTTKEETKNNYIYIIILILILIIIILIILLIKKAKDKNTSTIKEENLNTTN